jgi:adenine-specific DNA-methyltransferase
LTASGQVDDYGNQLFQNTESNGRFHSDWLSMIYPRLKLARNLLREDGVIFISIDDGEVHNLRKICDEVFGERNFIAQCVRKRRDSQANLSKNISPIHEYLIIYAKNNGEVLNKIPAKINEENYKNPDNDERGPYVTMPCTNKGGAVYSITTPMGNIITEEWRFKEETYYKLLSDNKIVFPRGGEGKPRYKLFLSEKKEKGILANTWLDNVSSNQEATREIKEIFNTLLFDNPKPTGLLKFCLQLASKKNSIILDFFSGSATTAHAVMQLNAEDGGNRKYIMVQLPEPCPENSEAYRAGFKNISEIGKERIRRAAKKIKEETGAEIDYGFRVFNVDSSNMKDVYYHPKELTQQQLAAAVSNIKEDRTSEDLLFQVMLQWDLELSLPHAKKNILGKEVHFVAGNSLVACFDEGVSEKLIKEIAKEKPLRVVFRDSSFASDAARINVEELFKLLSPGTEIKVI